MNTLAEANAAVRRRIAARRDRDAALIASAVRPLFIVDSVWAGWTRWRPALKMAAAAAGISPGASRSGSGGKLSRILALVSAILEIGRR